MSSCFGATPWISACVPALLALSLLACSVTKLGATDADLARARDQAAQGAAIFSQECARCHGERGEGLAGAGPVLGPGALPEFPRDNAGPSSMVTDPQQLQIQTQTRPAGAPWRDPFRSAQDLYDFTVGHMPKARAASLRQDDYWAVVTFMIAVQGGQVPSGGINAGNVRSIPIPKR